MGVFWGCLIEANHLRDEYDGNRVARPWSLSVTAALHSGKPHVRRERASSAALFGATGVGADHEEAGDGRVGEAVAARIWHIPGR